MKRRSSLPSALVLLSGGLDSVVALWWARKRYRVSTIAFHVPITPRAEIRAARDAARAAGVTNHLEIPLDFLEDHRTGFPPAYLPGRNLIYYAVAGSFAERIGADLLVGGHLKTDGETFRDAKREFFRALEKIVNLPVRVPFLDKSKEQIIRLGRSLGAPIDRSWSCYRDVLTPCGKCVACRERATAFRRAREGK